jgi:hypothetical protein
MREALMKSLRKFFALAYRYCLESEVDSEIWDPALSRWLDLIEALLEMD